MTKARHSGALKGRRFPPEIISYAVWSYFWFPLSLRDVEDLLAARNTRAAKRFFGKLFKQYGRR